MAVPMTVKMPEPMTMPTPIAVSETGPRDFLRAFSGSSESEINLSMDLVAKIWRGRARVLVGGIYRIVMIVCGSGAEAEIQRAEPKLRPLKVIRTFCGLFIACSGRARLS
jgi:hypothetical protein